MQSADCMLHVTKSWVTIDAMLKICLLLPLLHLVHGLYWLVLQLQKLASK